MTNKWSFKMPFAVNQYCTNYVSEYIIVFALLKRKRISFHETKILSSNVKKAISLNSSNYNHIGFLANHNYTVPL